MRIEISDSGIGVPETVRERVFDPFFTTKELGKGIGLGLAMTRTIVEAHGGTIELGETSPEGTTVALTFPLSPNGDRLKGGGEADS